MTDEQSNAAAESLPISFDLLNQLDSAPGRYLITDDFYAEDHRRMPLFGRISGDEFVAVNDQFWNVGSGRPHFTVEEIVAARGDHLAAVEFFADMADGMALHAILVGAPRHVRARLLEPTPANGHRPASLTQRQLPQRTH